jgi:hypothetical protein
LGQLTVSIISIIIIAVGVLLYYFSWVHIIFFPWCSQYFQSFCSIATQQTLTRMIMLYETTKINLIQDQDENDNHHHSSSSSFVDDGTTTTSSLSSSSIHSHDEDIPLPLDYVPSPSDVICARGRAYWEHPGNITYRRLIQNATPRYSQTNTKLERTLVVTEIVRAIEKDGGKFIKKVKKGGPWVIVDEVFAREKVRLRKFLLIFGLENEPYKHFFWKYNISCFFYKTFYTTL